MAVQRRAEAMASTRLDGVTCATEEHCTNTRAPLVHTSGHGAAREGRRSFSFRRRKLYPSTRCGWGPCSLGVILCLRANTRTRLLREGLPEMERSAQNLPPLPVFLVFSCSAERTTAGLPLLQFLRPTLQAAPRILGRRWRTRGYQLSCPSGRDAVQSGSSPPTCRVNTLQAAPVSQSAQSCLLVHADRPTRTRPHGVTCQLGHVSAVSPETSLAAPLEASVPWESPHCLT
jgi:hypothetical protein